MICNMLEAFSWRRQLRVRLLRISRLRKRVYLMSLDAVVTGLAVWISFCLRYDRWELPDSSHEWFVILSAPVVAIPVFVAMGLYRPVVRYLPERALWTIFQAITLAVIAWVILAFFSQTLWNGLIPRSVPVVYWSLAYIAVAGSRFVAKWILLLINRDSIALLPAVLIYGAGKAGTQLAQSLRATHNIAGFIDDDPALQGHDVAGIRVYPAELVQTLVDESSVKQVILSLPSASAVRRREIFEEVSKFGVKVQSLPDIIDIVTGRYLISQIREIDVDDLLGRSSVPPDLQLIREMVMGRTIMVTGAGGSIGSELCRKIARWSPQRLVLFEANEFALYNIDREMSGMRDVTAVPILGSVTDRRLVDRTLLDFSVDAVFHAAAHKHVPLVEANVLEGIHNNVFGTKTIVDAAFSAGVKNFVLISTDKAVRPTNVMGATKRWAELILIEKAMAAEASGAGQRFCSVRFGNVLGSNGSVVPLFKEQIAKGGPVTLTDPAMTRYFMSIKEAAELIVQAGALSEGGDVFLLDMGEPILISDLAENMVRLAGLSVKGPANPQGDIEIIATGKRPGEKLFEELFYDDSSAQRTRHPKILRASASVAGVDMSSKLEELRAALTAEDERHARSVLFDLITQTDGAHG